MNEQLLKKHFASTPRMEPTDAVKLAYQSAFGCGHLLSARQACADFVRREMQGVPPRAGEPCAVGKVESPSAAALRHSAMLRMRLPQAAAILP